MPEINPETNEVVEKITRTCEMRVGNADALREIIRRLIDKGMSEADAAWYKGFRVGFVVGSVVTGLVIAAGAWIHFNLIG